MESFKKLGLIEPILKAIQEQKFEKPSDIQEKSIPIILEGKDVIAGSATGSGKTLAFGSGIIQNAKPGAGIQAIVLTPTRELATQNAKTLATFSRYKRMKIVTVYGGVAIGPQIKSLRDADVVIATPGRTLDHLERGTIDLRKVNIVVLDEADRMFEMGFIEDVEKILKSCPQNRQTMLFSATISDGVCKIAQRYMNNPVEISVESFVDPKKLAQVYYDVQEGMKFSLLVHLLKEEKKQSKSLLSMVFCNTQRSTDFIADNLNRAGIKTLAIHGGLSQEKRNRVMDEFHSKNVPVLVCTDVASRGLDIKGVSHVYNYDIPKDPKQYIHRIGRTARAGKEGIAVNLLSQRDYDNYTAVLREVDAEIKQMDKPYVERVQVVFNNERSGGRFGGRNGGFRGGRESEGRRPFHGGGHREGRSEGQPRGHGRAQHSGEQKSHEGQHRGYQKKPSGLSYEKENKDWFD